MHAKTVLAAFATVSIAHAAVWNITVGQSGLTFSPNQVTAAVGDTLHFVVSPGHSATQAGMVFAANAPTSGQTFAAFQAAAQGKVVSTNSSSTSAAAGASTTGSTPTGPYGNGASVLESKSWMVGVAAFLGGAAMI
ncbi:hypothetical protein FS837_005863 [Tulasnella sp. UAMH 9824]|nr:hypothetical protein FS837_005863 [Tulasnella sp. UAMH 9824]